MRAIFMSIRVFVHHDMTIWMLIDLSAKSETSDIQFYNPSIIDQISFLCLMF